MKTILGFFKRAFNYLIKRKKSYSTKEFDKVHVTYHSCGSLKSITSRQGTRYFEKHD